jgi:beta-glucosidase
MKADGHYTREDLEAVFDGGFHLPDGFLFGVANSAYQVEGGFNGPGEPCNNWAKWERSGRAEPTGESARFWNDYPAFIELARDIGLGGFRMGLDWSRVQPATYLDAGRVPPFDDHAVERYSDILAAMKAAGLEPMVTLQMFTHPLWLGIDLWLDEKKVDFYLEFVEHVCREVNSLLLEKHRLGPIRYWITINEPNILSLMSYLMAWYPHGVLGVRKCGRAWGNMISAHARAYDLIHQVYSDNGWSEPAVSFNTGCASPYLLGKVALDIVAARTCGIERDSLPVHLSSRKEAFEEEVSRCPAVRPVSRTVRLLEKALLWGTSVLFDINDFSAGVDALYASPRPRKMDFIGIDVYDPFFASMVRRPGRRTAGGVGILPAAREWEWTVNPAVLYHFLKAESSGIEGVPVIVVENGMAYRVKRGKAYPRLDGMTRDRFLQGFLFEAMRAMKEGVPLQGYFHWTLVDTYEWGTYQPRFGLYTVDRANRASVRPVDCWGTDAAGVYGEIVAALSSGDNGRMIDVFERDFATCPPPKKQSVR